MTADKLLKLLKSGIWEDALLAFEYMKDWTYEEVQRNFMLEDYYKLDLGDSSHIKPVIKLNDKLFVIPGGSWSIRFVEHVRPSQIDLIL